MTQTKDIVNPDVETVKPKVQEAPKGPVVETSITTSRDGKWVIHKTIITDIKAVGYYTKVLEGLA